MKQIFKQNPKTLNPKTLKMLLTIFVSLIIQTLSLSTYANVCTSIFETGLPVWYSQQKAFQLGDFKVYDTWETSNPSDGVFVYAYRELPEENPLFGFKKKNQLTPDSYLKNEPRRLALAWLSPTGYLIELPILERHILALDRNPVDGTMNFGAIQVELSSQYQIILFFNEGKLSILRPRPNFPLLALQNELVVFEKSQPAQFNPTLKKYISTRSKIEHQMPRTFKYIPREVIISKPTATTNTALLNSDGLLLSYPSVEMSFPFTQFIEALSVKKSFPPMFLPPWN
ncbi:MAG TPA: hypothetical protein PLJ21_02535 [Pseudobdellovibrionaceae bacterium]|nr:hypothetical protein [Pseudobdellovibrionaceae bacterium]